MIAVRFLCNDSKLAVLLQLMIVCCKYEIESFHVAHE
jgi:hypothetical protein